MTDLHDKARNLLALREKATPGPWLMRWKSNSLHKAPPPNTPYTYGDFVITVGSDDHDGEKTEDVDFIAAAHDMADTIRDLLAENERLAAALSAAKEIILKLDADRAAVYARAEAAEGPPAPTYAQIMDAINSATDATRLSEVLGIDLTHLSTQMQGELIEAAKAKEMEKLHQLKALLASIGSAS